MGGWRTVAEAIATVGTRGASVKAEHAVSAMKSSSARRGDINP